MEKSALVRGNNSAQSQEMGKGLLCLNVRNVVCLEQGVELIKIKKQRNCAVKII